MSSAPAQPPPQASPQPRVPRVLVVEDDPGNALVIRKILTRLGGMTVELTEDGDLVVARAAAGDVDIVVMDVSLGNTKVAGSSVDGLELTRRLLAAAASAGRRVRVLIATAHAMRGDRERFLGETGAHGYVAKPITDHPAFAAEVRRLFDELAEGPAGP